jgi:hypothetical protein
MTVIEALKTVSNYPIPTAVLERIAVARDLEPTGVMNAVSFTESKYRLAEADTMLWIADAPNFTEGGVIISFSGKEKDLLRSKAHSIYKGFNETVNDISYGYIGTSL